jgi:hypothetical protein
MRPMRKAVIASGLLLVGYIACAAACGGSGSTNIPDGGGGSAGTKATGGSDGTGAGGTKGAGTGGSKGAATGGATGSGSAGTAGTGSSGTSGTAGAGGTAGTSTLHDGGTTDGGSCSGIGMGAMQIYLGPTCSPCMATSCCSETTACAASTDCRGLVDCVAACIVDGGTESKCELPCVSKYPTGVGLAMKFGNCESASCKSSCGS